jgi:cell wall-associated NlpC family hydrolase
LEQAEKAHRIADPGSDPTCIVGSWAPGFNAALAQIAAGLADGRRDTANLTGLGNYYQAKEDALQETEPVPGSDSLVQRLAPTPFNEIGAPIAPDATDAWSLLGSTDGVTVPLGQIAVEYAWFFGGVISPFNSAGKLIGSLADGAATTVDSGAVQVSVGPAGCPNNAPDNTLRDGATEIGIHKLCVDSVREAATPAAAKAIKWALTHLGKPYSQHHRNDDGYFDCSSFVSRAYRDGAIPGLYSGNAPTTNTLRTLPWVQRITSRQAMPGDLVEPNPGHVTMLLADGYRAETNRTGDVSKVDRPHDSSVYWAGRVIAGRT